LDELKIAPPSQYTVRKSDFEKVVLEVSDSLPSPEEVFKRAFAYLDRCKQEDAERDHLGHA
jgi:hypothetical protein